MTRFYRFLFRACGRLIHLMEKFLMKVQRRMLSHLPSEEHHRILLNYHVESLPMYAGPHVWGTELYRELFHMLEERGVHVTPNHFYSPVPDTRELASSDLWEKESELPGIEMNIKSQLDLLRNAFPVFQEEYNAFSHQKTEDMPPYEFHFNNGVFDGIDALILYAMVRHLKPKRIIEVGSGWSTRLSACAAVKNGNTRLTSIEPYPDAFLMEGFPGLSELLPKKVQEVEVAHFQQLEAGDILFIDTSHVVRMGGDVNYLYLEVLPRLKKGVIIHVHDVFFPWEYPRSWIFDHLLFWNEQYLLQAFLTFNSHFQVLFANRYMDVKYFSDMQAAFPKAPFYHTGQSLWMKRVR